jgi:hypothetical protein
MKNGWHKAFKFPLGSVAMNVLINLITLIRKVYLYLRWYSQGYS